MVSRHSVMALGALSALVVAALSANVAHWHRVSQGGKTPATPAPSTDALLKRLTDGHVVSGPPSMLHLDAHHTNRSPFSGPSSAKVEWAFDTGEPIKATPIVLDDGTIVVASLGGTLFALDP